MEAGNVYQEDLDFAGGPWELRNGEIVEKLIRVGSEFYPFYKSKNLEPLPAKHTMFWNKFGDAIDVFGYSKKEYDLVRYLVNWKYLREKGID